MADSENLVLGVQNTAGIQDRPEVQLSDGMDSGETKDPPPRES